MKFVHIMILLAILTAGCISPQIRTGMPAQYELPGLADTTIFYLNLSSVEIIYNVINKSSIDFGIEDGIESFSNPAAVDYSLKNVSMNVTMKSVRGRNYAHLNFSSNFSGFVAFTRPGGQDFTFVPQDNNTVRVVLPENFTAGTSFIGYISPDPDNITHDQKGREVLIWKNPQNKKIRVRYHEKDTPLMLMYLFGFLSMCGIAVWMYYYRSISSLRKKREMLEKEPPR